MQRDCPTPAEGSPRPSSGRGVTVSTAAVAKSSQPQTEGQKAKQKLMQCFNCGILGQLAKVCWKPRKDQSSGKGRSVHELDIAPGEPAPEIGALETQSSQRAWWMLALEGSMRPQA